MKMTFQIQTKILARACRRLARVVTRQTGAARCSRAECVVRLPSWRNARQWRLHHACIPEGRYGTSGSEDSQDCGDRRFHLLRVT